MELMRLKRGISYLDGEGGSKRLIFNIGLENT